MPLSRWGLRLWPAVAEPPSMWCTNQHGLRGRPLTWPPIGSVQRSAAVRTRKPRAPREVRVLITLAVTTVIRGHLMTGPRWVTEA
jgi:hypothetical protein